jgi:hypothetical protein
VSSLPKHLLAEELKPQLDNMCAALSGEDAKVQSLTQLDRILVNAMLAFCNKVLAGKMAHGPLLAHARALGPPG